MRLLSNKEKIMIFIILLVVVFVALFYKNETLKEIKYVNRKTGNVEVEKVAGEGYLKWLYYNPIGQLATKTIVKNRFLSEFYGKKMKSPDSKFDIPAFVVKFDINLDESQEQYFDSFNDFFIRKLKPEARPIDNTENSLVSPADGKILAFPNLSDTTSFFIKGKKFDLEKFFEGKDIYKNFIDGTMLIIRLCPTDYHRYHFPVDGLAGEDVRIEGDYLSVSPYAVKQNIDIYFNNKRSYSVIESEKFGKVVMAEIGATMVGSIIQTYKKVSQVKKGDEKGYFEFGGSTTILFFEKGKVQIDEDILKNSKNALETSVLMGEKIGNNK